MKEQKIKSKSTIKKWVPRMTKGKIFAARALLANRRFQIDEETQSSSSETNSKNVDDCENDSTLDESVTNNSHLNKDDAKSDTIVPESPASTSSEEICMKTTLEIESLCSDNIEDRRGGLTDICSMEEGDEETQLPESNVNEFCASLAAQLYDSPIPSISSILSLNELSLQGDLVEISGEEVAEIIEKVEIEERDELSTIIDNILGEAGENILSNPIENEIHEYLGCLLADAELACFW